MIDELENDYLGSKFIFLFFFYFFLIFKGPTLRKTTARLYYQLYIFDIAGHLYRCITIIRRILFVLNCSSLEWITSH